jgi:peptidyl-prolyl cis-trans isomerase B (cyclophilin B)
MSQPHATVVPLKTNVLAIISLISAFIIPLAAVITGYIAQSQIRRTGEEGRGMARAGVIIGMVGTVLQGLFLIVWVSSFLSIMGGMR